MGYHMLPLFHFTLADIYCGFEISYADESSAADCRNGHASRRFYIRNIIVTK